MPENVVYIAIFKTEEMTVTIEYKPLTAEWDFGAIEILSVDIQPARTRGRNNVKPTSAADW